MFHKHTNDSFFLDMHMSILLDMVAFFYACTHACRQHAVQKVLGRMTEQTTPFTKRDGGTVLLLTGRLSIPFPELVCWICCELFHDVHGMQEGIFPTLIPGGRFPCSGETFVFPNPGCFREAE